MKKALKWFAIIFGLIIVLLAVTPFLFKDKIQNLVIKTINQNLDATVNFKEVDLSLFKSFPLATVSISELSVINKAPFQGDTLVYSENINLRMSIKELFKSEGEAMNIESFSINNALVNVIFNPDGIGNFDIALKDEEEKEEDNQESSPFAMTLQNYSVENLKFVFHDQGSKMKMILDKINHEGKGDFNNSILDLDTYTTAVTSFEMDGTEFMKNVDITLDAILNLDLENAKYTFKDNLARINKLPLEFNGFLQLKEEGQDYDLTFNTPTTSFSNFLGLIPSAYSGSLENIKTTGDFQVSGKVKGQLTENTIPMFDVVMASNNASFKYPDLPKSVENIVIDVKVKNETGIVKDTYVNLDKLSFKIDQDIFSGNAKIKNLTENMMVDANVNGTVNLANLSQAYPIKLDKKISGIIMADAGLSLDMNSIEQEKYENVHAQGNMSLTGFKYEGEELAKPLVISEADLKFNPSKVSLNKFNAKTGKSDIQANGTLDNFYGFIFKDQVLKGDFKLNSNYLEISDFMTTSAPTTETKTEEKSAESLSKEQFKIPSFLDCTITANATKVVYDNLTLSDVSGKLSIKNETVALNNVITSIFGGKIGLDGSVSTKEKTPKFDMNLDLKALDIVKAFTDLDMLQKIAPIANVISGKFTSAVKLQGDLTSEFTPNLNTMTGDLFGQFLETKIHSEKSKLLSTLDSQVKFIDLSKINLDKVKAHLTFENGKVNVKPIDFAYQDIKLNLSGTHGFDQQMNYALAFDVPAKLLGNEVSGLLSKLSGSQLENTVIPIKANITGSFSQPKVQTDLNQAITTLTNKVVENQKNELINKGKDALNDKLGNSLGKDVNIPVTKEEVNQKVEETKEQINQKVEEKKEEIKNQAKDKAKDALKNLLGGKK